MAGQEDPRLDPLFTRLVTTDDPFERSRTEDRIWQLWLSSGNEETDRLMRQGVRAMNAHDYDQAMDAFDTIVRTRPEFAEGWNKRATLHYLMGDFEESIADIERTLALEPRHFGALSGMAMIREAQGRPFEALEALEQVLRIHPGLPHLQLRIDRLTAELGEPI